MSKKFADYEKLLGTIPRKGYLEEYAEKFKTFIRNDTAVLKESLEAAENALTAFKEFDEFTRKIYHEQRPSIDKNGFIFATGTPLQIYETQTTALRFAAWAFDCNRNMTDMFGKIKALKNAVDENNYDKFINLHLKAIKSRNQKEYDKLSEELSKYRKTLKRKLPKFWNNIMHYNAIIGLLMILIYPVGITYGIISCIASSKERKRFNKADNYEKQIIQAFKKSSDIKLLDVKIQPLKNELKTACDQTKQRVEEIYTCIQNVMKVNNDEYEKATDFLPENLNRSWLPSIISKLESGAARDYQTALWQVTQMDQQERIAYEARARQEIAIEKQLQRQEYYEQQRLSVAREQAEAQKRLEQLAKQQTEFAEQQAKAAQAAAKSAEKQSENSSEMLRRLDDPYYINKLKND